MEQPITILTPDGPMNAFLAIPSGEGRGPALLVCQDQSIPPGHIAAIRERLTALGSRHQIVLYPDAGRGFACDERASYHKPSADEAWRVTFDWLERNLPPHAR